MNTGSKSKGCSFQLLDFNANCSADNSVNVTQAEAQKEATMSENQVKEKEPVTPPVSQTKIRIDGMDRELTKQSQEDDELVSYKSFVYWLMENSKYQADKTRPLHHQLEDFSYYLNSKFERVEQFYAAMEAVGNALKPSTSPKVAVVRPQGKNDSTKTKRQNEHYENLERRRPNYKYYCCCGIMFDSKCQMDKHLIHINCQRKYKCLKCCKRYRFKTQLQQHECGGQNTSYLLMKHQLGTSPKASSGTESVCITLDGDDENSKDKSLSQPNTNETAGGAVQVNSSQQQENSMNA